LAYLRQDCAEEGFAVGEVRVAHPYTFIATKAPSRQAMARHAFEWQAPKQAMATKNEM
jgi:hypothetical protein